MVRPLGEPPPWSATAGNRIPVLSGDCNRRSLAFTLPAGATATLIDRQALPDRLFADGFG